MHTTSHSNLASGEQAPVALTAPAHQRVRIKSSHLTLNRI